LSDRGSPSPEQLAQFYERMGSNHLRVRENYRVSDAAPRAQLSLDVTDTPAGPEDYEVDSGYLVDLSALTEARMVGQVWEAASAGTTAHLHYSPDRVAWGDIGENVALDVVGEVSTDYAPIPEGAQRVVALGFGIEEADGTTPVNVTFVVQFR
jgi:hypothetical protein